MTNFKTKIAEAMEFAVCAHRGQYRKGTKKPYIVHPLTVFEICRQVTDNENYLIAALLHDTIEDTNVTYEEIEQLFGKEVADIVELVTLRDEDGGYLEKRRENIFRILQSKSEGALLIRCCDAIANLNSMLKDLQSIKSNNFFKRFNGSKNQICTYYLSLAREVFFVRNEFNLPKIISEEFISLFNQLKEKVKFVEVEIINIYTEDNR